jgi:AAA15 family ATPase/GTPase
MKTYLKGFGLENFRAFKDYTWFDFAPITILTGPNSSGKSSLNKALMLMKDNIKAEDISNGYQEEVKHLITDPLAFKYDGSDHNLSSAANAINNLSESPYISFYFKRSDTWVIF